VNGIKVTQYVPKIEGTDHPRRVLGETESGEGYIPGDISESEVAR